MGLLCYRILKYIYLHRILIHPRRQGTWCAEVNAISYDELMSVTPRVCFTFTVVHMFLKVVLIFNNNGLCLEIVKTSSYFMFYTSLAQVSSTLIFLLYELQLHGLSNSKFSAAFRRAIYSHYPYSEPNQSNFSFDT